MEEQNTNLENPLVETNKRPTFLTVLCILSFVGIGIGIISEIYSLLTFSKTIEMMNQYKGMMGGTSMGGMIDSLETWGQTLYVIEIVANAICLVGVFMMWKLNKAGYFIYIVGEIAPAAASFALMGGYGMLGAIAMTMGLIIPAAFLIMYGLNLKNMK